MFEIYLNDTFENKYNNISNMPTKWQITTDWVKAGS